MWPSLVKTEWYVQHVAVLRLPPPAPVVPDEKAADDADLDNAAYDAAYASTVVYAEYENLDATDRISWVHADNEFTVEVAYYRMNVHFYSMKGGLWVQTIVCECVVVSLKFRLNKTHL